MRLSIISLPLKPTLVLLCSEESLSNKGFLIVQIFRARKLADMAKPTAIPVMAYSISEGQGGIEQGASISHHTAKDFHSSLYIRMKFKVIHLVLNVPQSNSLRPA